MLRYEPPVVPVRFAENDMTYDEKSYKRTALQLVMQVPIEILRPTKI